MVFCDDGVEESANKIGKGETSSTYYFHRYEKKKFKIKRKINTITYISKHMSTFEFRHNSPAIQELAHSGSVFFQCFVLFEKR